MAMRASREKDLNRTKVDSTDAEGSVERYHKRLLTTMETARGGESQYLSMGIITGIELAGYAAAANPSRPEVCEGLAIAARLAGALFGRTQSAKEILVDLGGDGKTPISHTGPSAATNAANWRMGFLAACICRDKDTLHSLAVTPVEVLRKSATKADPAYFVYVEAMQALWLRAEDTGKKLIAALEALDPGRLDFMPRNFALDLLTQEVNLAFRLADGDSKGFNDGLRYAVARHKEYWSEPNLQNDPGGYLALGPLAFASLANDAKLTFSVESTYFPESLWRGDCRGGKH